MPFAPLALILTSLALLPLTGCIGLAGAGTPTATKNSSPAAAGTLTASVTSLSFGNVVDGKAATQTLTLTNTGTATVTVSQGTVTGQFFSLVGSMSSVVIDPGANHSFQLQYAPTSAGAVTGILRIISDATNSPLSVDLTGTGNEPLVIASQPANQSVTAGKTATFSVIATGTGTLSYQWKKNGTAIGGGTAATYTTPATATSDNGAQFTVVVTDNDGSLTSNAATLDVTAAPVAPSITAQPASKAVAAGQTATFSVTATGTATLSYQWKINGTAISGATASSYTTPATAASDNGAQFTVTVTNSVSSVTSSAATLTVNVPPTITAPPANKTVNVGQTATFDVTATGSGSLIYQWSKNSAAISGATSASYTTPATTASDNGAKFTVTVTDSVGSVTSKAATLTVNTPASIPSITSQPASTTVIAGQTASFSVSAGGTAPLTYQWNKNGAAIGGATSPSYTTPATTTVDSGAQFTVTVSNSAGKITSGVAMLTVSPATFILNASQTSLTFASANIGGNSTLPVTFTNGGNSNVTISSVVISGAGYTAGGIPSGQIVLPGHTATLNVTFAPSAAGILAGSVTITSKATNSPATITLSGTGVQPVSHSVTLTWTASTSAAPRYNVYRSTVSGGPYTKLNNSLVAATTYDDLAVQSGQTYYYVVTTIDSNNVESAFSTEVSATVP